MRTRPMWRKLFQAALGLCAAGMTLGTSCGTDELQAVVAGIEAAASAIDGTSRSQNITLGDWLASELQN